MNGQQKTPAVLAGLAALFLALAAAFLGNLWGRPAALPNIPLVDPIYTNTMTVRTNYNDLVLLKADLTDFDCNACHDPKKPPVIRFDTNQNIIVPPEHEDIVMKHGSHNRNNNCFNCHNETNLVVLQTRDGRVLTFDNSPPLCGSCHGPTYRDWEAGVHGRTSGYWDRALGPFERKPCAACHNPHAPKFPPRHPAPGPHPLRQAIQTATVPEERSH
ncbi:MAG: hypothetical protein ABSC03_01990 [Verrucomicrobiota bacterium]|jgi:hypothetical protein